LLSVLLLTLNLLAALETLGVSQDCKNAIASSIAAMVVEILRGEVLLMVVVKVCKPQGCASHRDVQATEMCKPQRCASHRESF
jgi:hypothetical protein